MSKPNWKNKTVFIGDNLHVMWGMNSGCVDLIYLDPPFNSNQDYAAPIGSEAAGAAFKDTWTLDDVDVIEHDVFRDRERGLYAVINTAKETHSKGMFSYLLMMAQRLLEMRRLLKPTGSIYLHCDPTASHYLKLLMDSVFGRGNFQNELTWKRTSSHSDAKRYARVSDRLLFYAFEGATWHTQYLPLGKAYVARDYRHTDKTGRYRVGDLTGPGQSGGESGEPWQGFDPGDSGRCWSVPKTGKYARWIEDNLIPGYGDIGGVHARLDALSQAGLIDRASTGYPRLKRYLKASPGEAVSDFIADIQNVNNRSKEDTDFKTQKPLALLDRIIQASSNEGDVVLDPFCGCGTTMVSANGLDRQWIGCDLSKQAIDLVLDRIKKAQGLWRDITACEAMPRRTDKGDELSAAGKREYKKTLYGKNEGHCAGCGMHYHLNILEMNHVIPKAKGGTDHADNFQLLCSRCNRRKGRRSHADLMADLSRKPQVTLI